MKKKIITWASLMFITATLLSGCSAEDIISSAKIKTKALVLDFSILPQENYTGESWNLTYNPDLFTCAEGSAVTFTYIGEAATGNDYIRIYTMRDADAAAALAEMGVGDGTSYSDFSFGAAGVPALYTQIPGDGLESYMAMNCGGNAVVVEVHHAEAADENAEFAINGAIEQVLGTFELQDA